MEDQIIFSGTTCVEIQGPRVLRFIGLTEDSAEFEVIGLSSPKVRVIDKRPSIIKAMETIIDSGEVHTLAPQFNTPARITISKEKCEELSVKLEKTRAKKPRHMLWVAIGMENEALPHYWYVNVQIQKMENEKFALFSLYRRPRQKKKLVA